MLNKEYFKTFEIAVKKYFRGIAKKYSCEMRRIKDSEFELHSDKYNIKIVMCSENVPIVSVSIVPNPNIYKRLGNKEFGIRYIAKYGNPNLDIGLQEIHNMAQLYSSVEKQAATLEIYCKKILEGDLSEWRKIAKMFKKEMNNIMKNTTTANKLIGKSVILSIGDPWDFETEQGTGILKATIIAIKKDNFLLKLEKIVVFRNVECEYLVASTRYHVDIWDEISKNKPVTIAATVISKDRALGKDPFDLSWWRGGIGLLGDMTLITHPVP
ncbi:MAG: hypothetical protein WC955_05635 [Elusimicrobiota bacterium]